LPQFVFGIVSLPKASGQLRGLACFNAADILARSLEGRYLRLLARGVHDGKYPRATYNECDHEQD
tara:strand:+ start:1619 stop:1813 length:195 start_codon:yes stop_codon:yes gene_type:complete